jgi:5-methylcytosine-specific restriction protein A
MTNWIVPCNTKYYDVCGAFDKLKVLDWKQTNPNVKEGDFVYIYIGKPIQSILYKCKVIQIDLPKVEIDDSEFYVVPEKYVNSPKHMRLELIRNYQPGELSSEILAQYGEKGRIMCQRRMGQTLEKYIEMLEC